LRSPALKKAQKKDCQGIFPKECMDFDHVKGNKLFEIGPSFLRNRKEVEIEIEKCDLICANCHRIRTRKRQNGI